MDLKTAINERHSVRQYTDAPIEEEKVVQLNEAIREANRESGLNMQLILNDPDCFNVFLAHYGKFQNAVNYIAMVGDKSLAGLEEKAGYFGQKIVLLAQQIGLNTCWVAGTYGKGKCKAQIGTNEKLVCVIAVGYGENQGKEHKSKPLWKLCKVPASEMPPWFAEGVEAALKAPTAINQQKFVISLENEEAVITAKSAVLAKVDLGIVRYNFEAASGHKVKR